MANCEIHEHVGIGQVRFGMTRATIRSLLGNDYSAFRKTPDSLNTTDVYDSLGLHLYYDTSDNLEFIETYSPCKPTFESISLCQDDAAVVVDALSGLGFEGNMSQGSMFFDAVGIALIIDGERVAGVSIYPKGYYDKEAQ